MDTPQTIEDQGLLAFLLRAVIDRAPRFPGITIARRLIAQANAARDGRRYQVAAALYEEALRFAPANPRVHVQAGHMFKEAGDFRSAEQHYQAALRIMPDNADLALQLGHFYKQASRIDEAQAAYRRALDLRPGWFDPADELARLGDSDQVPREEAEGFDWVVTELLPRPREEAPLHKDTIQIRRLGTRITRSRWGMMKTLGGVEAVRGFCLSSVPIQEIQVLVDGALARTAPLTAHPIDSADADQRKYVFNVWLDLSHILPGRREITLRLVDGKGRVQIRKENILVAPPPREDAFPGSDALVDAPPGPVAEIDDWVDARPSMVRPAARSVLAGPVRAILVQRVDQLGDLLCSLPAIRRLRALFPEAKLIGLLTAANAALARSLDLFDDIVLADFPKDNVNDGRAMSIGVQDSLRHALAAYRFDIAIDLGEGAESRPLLQLSGARLLFGFKGRDWPWLTAGLEFNARDPINWLEVMPPSHKIVALVEALGAMLLPCADIVRAPRRDDILVRHGIGPSEQFVVLHAGSTLGFNRWLHFTTLAEMLADDAGLKVLLFADEADGTSRPRRDLIESGRIRLLVGQLPLDEFDAVLAAAAAFVGNDSGPKHLAALRGVPVVSVHSARTNWAEWGQEQTGVIVSRRVPCAGCGITVADECGKDFACLSKIKPSEVYGAIVDLLPTRQAAEASADC